MWWDKPSKDGKQATAKPETVLPFMRYRWIGFLVTAILLVGTTVSLLTQGLNFGLDFTGGVLIEASRTDGFDVEAVRGSLASAGFAESVVQLTDQGRVALIRLPLTETGEDVESVTRMVTAALGEGVLIQKTDAVGPKVSGELLRGGIIASIASVLVIAIYVWFRFESKFGLAALLTTFHDVYSIVGLFSITQMAFDLNVVAALLAIAGYSINDTVVVFDRIRELLRKYKKLPIGQIIDTAVTATLTRTVVTAGTTLLASVSILLFGGPVLFGFAAAISFGIVIGTYSSIFVAAPMIVYLPGRIPGARRASEEDDAATQQGQGA